MIYRRRSFPEQRAQSFPQLRRVLMLMHGNRMLDGSFEQLLLAVGRDRYGTMGCAREFPAVDVFAAHDASLQKGADPETGGAFLV
jgi:hypothetical protein